MFETEVVYAAETLRLAGKVGEEPGLVLFDELFHSTNPPDSARTAQLFLQSLWGRRHTFSIVSTHVFPLVEGAPKETVQAICCPATEKEGGVIEYGYSVQPGICRVSSVKKVWERFGLVAAAGRQPAKPAEEGEPAPRK
jgi:DNA mismatch repair ATPase MutS